MAAPGRPDSTRTCERCFATVAGGALYCPECGFSFVEGDGPETTDQASYDELGRANLMRIRGDSKQAVDICLGILRRTPNNLTAHTLLGDIHAELGELDQAVSWYELGLDLAPDSVVVQHKLDEIRRRKAEREAAGTVEKLQEERSQSRVWSWTAVAVAVVVLVAGVGFALLGLQERSRPRQTVTTPVVIEPLPQPAQTPEPPTPVVVEGPDTRLLEVLRDRLGSTALIAAALDPRGPTVTLTFRLQPGEDPVVAAAELGLATFDAGIEAQYVTLRAVQGDGLLWVADMERSAWEAAGTTRQDLDVETAASLLQSVWESEGR